MELRDYIRLISRSIWQILGITIGLTAIVMVWTLLQPLKYESSATVVVNKPNPVPQRGASFYQFDKFYSIQASSLFADTLTAWLSSPSTAREIFEKAGLPVPDVNLKKLSRIFKPRRLPPATISVTAADPDKERTEKLVAAAVAILEQKTEEQRRADDPDHYFTLVTSQVVTAPARPDLALNALLAVIGGLLLGTVWAFFREYLKQK